MIIQLLVIFHFILVISVTLRILWRHDLSPVARLAWFIILLILPYISVAVYWMFGEANLGFGADNKRQEIIKTLQHTHATALGNAQYVNDQVAPRYHPALAYAASVNGFYATAGNRATLLPDAQSTKAQMIADFDAATDHI